MANVKIKMNGKYIEKRPLTGNEDFDQDAFDYRSNLLSWGCSSKKDGDLIVVELLNGATLNMVDFAFIMSKDDGEVLNFPTACKMLTEDMENEVPEGLPNRIGVTPAEVEYNEETGEETIITEASTYVKTWNQWIGENYSTKVIDSYTYFLTYAGNKGVPLTGTEAMVIYNLDYAELITKADYISLSESE